jgi:hypothetical protein
MNSPMLQHGNRETKKYIKSFNPNKYPFRLKLMENEMADFVILLFLFSQLCTWRIIAVI